MSKLSIVLPIYNEEQSIPELFAGIAAALRDHDYEVIAVDDGSRDGTLARLKELAARDPRVKVIGFRRNYGQTAAINAGIEHASGGIIVMMDSDLENSPEDIPLLLRKLEEGSDVVSGWRKDRWKGQFLTRKLPSLLANRLISAVSGVHLHDYGCTLKAYRREVIADVRLYGQMHRFIPVYCKWQGGTVAELPVRYQPRKYGRSNYGIKRTFAVVLDLVLIKFLERYMQRPIHFFGGAGFWAFLVSALSFGLALWFKLTGKKDFVQTPLPLFSAIFFVVGVLMVLMGVIAEMLMRTYYESQGKRTFAIKETMNL